jgi:arsenate reductase (thioredoxin)
MTTERQRVLILCTGNSCRSQMAEGFINHYLGDRWHAESAGTQPSGYVHPLAIRAMQELGIDLIDGGTASGDSASGDSVSGKSGAARSKSTEEFQGVDFDWVITVCDDAAENCPVWLGKGKKTHIGFEDPALAQGSDEEKMVVFRKVRDEIRTQVLGFLKGQDSATSNGGNPPAGEESQ